MGKRGRSRPPGFECIPKTLLFLHGSCHGASSLLFRGWSASAAFWTPARLYCHLPQCFRFPYFLMFTLNFPQSLGVILLTSLVFLLNRKGGGKELTKGGGETQLWLFTEDPLLSDSSSGLLKSWLPLLTLHQCLSQPHPWLHVDPPPPPQSSVPFFQILWLFSFSDSLSDMVPYINFPECLPVLARHFQPNYTALPSQSSLEEGGQ